MNKLGGSDFLGVTGMFLKVCELLLAIEVDRVFLELQEGCGDKSDPSHSASFVVLGKVTYSNKPPVSTVFH